MVEPDDDTQTDSATATSEIEANFQESEHSSAEAAEGVEGLGLEKEEEPAPTPFDHPLFLPILLSGLAVWFGYDGFMNSDPKMLEHVTFNRVGFAVLIVAAIYTGIKGYKEWKADR